MKKPEAEEPLKTKTVRGKYASLLERGSNVAILDRDVVDHFPDSESVNHALRTFLAMGQQFATLTASDPRPVRKALRRKSPLAFDPRTGRKTEKVAAEK